MTDTAAPSTPPSGSAAPDAGQFDSMAGYQSIPRLGGLALSRDGRRLVTSVATLDADGTSWVSALWEIDPAGQRPARRLTRSEAGESNPVFAADGQLLFTSKRPVPAASRPADQDEPAADSTDSTDSTGSTDSTDGADSPAAKQDKPTDKPKPALWALPAGGGEARPVAVHPGGVAVVRAAAAAGTVVFSAAAMPGAESASADTARTAARDQAGVTAILFEDYPVRHWDHDLGPAHSRLYAVDTGRPPVSRTDDGTADGDRRAESGRDVSPELPTAQDLEDYAVSPDGRWLAIGVQVPLPDGSRRSRLDLVDLRTGDQRTVCDAEGTNFGDPAFAPDSGTLICTRQSHSSWGEPGDENLWQVDVASGQGRELAPDFPHWPAHPVFAADGTAVFVHCDEGGHHPVFRVELADGRVTRLTGNGAYTDLQVHPDGNGLFALRATVDSPPLPVRLDTRAVDQDPAPLASPGSPGTLPGTLTEISTVVADGSTVRAWLVLPRGTTAETPAPLLLWIHGGPLMSWNAWSWRWNPWLMAARGYAVLLPDPALSAGYGQDFVRRGWGAWGAAPYTDLMEITDATVARDDIDETRTAAMGGSFGGYMANWVAGHTDRFQAIVTHASLWHLNQFSGTTDSAHYWAREFGDPLQQRERYDAHSPHHSVANIRTPMLVVHGDKDYRVPIGEALRLWYDLRRHGVESKFLYFPDENHWVLAPGNATVWYDTVLAFLAQHVLGEDWTRPELL